LAELKSKDKEIETLRGKNERLELELELGEVEDC
jgi:hypothetical protein